MNGNVDKKEEQECFIRISKIVARMKYQTYVFVTLMGLIGLIQLLILR